MSCHRLRRDSASLKLRHEASKADRSGDVRLHGHAFAGHAVMLGVPLPVAARLLGHRNAQMTLRCAHVANKEVEVAAERIGTAPTALLNEAE